jgi:hypothetical protein
MKRIQLKINKKIKFNGLLDSLNNEGLDPNILYNISSYITTVKRDVNKLVKGEVLSSGGFLVPSEKDNIFIFLYVVTWYNPSIENITFAQTETGYMSLHLSDKDAIELNHVINLITKTKSNG